MAEKEYKYLQDSRQLLSVAEVLYIVRDILRQWWVVLLMAVSMALLAGVYAEIRYVPKYESSTTFVVTSRSINSTVVSNLSTTRQLAEQFEKVLDTNILKKKVAESIGMDSFDAEMRMNLIDETNLMTLTVTADSPVKAYRIIRSIMENYDKVSDYVMDSVIIEVIQNPTVPSGPINQSGKRGMMKKAFLFTFLAMCAFFGLLSCLKETVKSEEDVRKYIDAKMLGTIYHERKWHNLRELRNQKQVSILINNPMMSFRYVECNKVSASKIAQQLAKRKKQVLMITSATENEGKSTVAANIALALTMQKKRVILIDCDFRKPAQFKVFQLKKGEFINLHDVLSGKEGAERLVKQIPDTDLYGIFNYTKDSHLLENREGRKLQKIIEQLRDKVDYIIIDSSPMGLVSDTEELAAMADVSLLVIRHDMVWAKSLNDMIDRLNRTNAHLIGCILNDMPAWFEISNSYGYGIKYGYGGHYGSKSE